MTDKLSLYNGALRAIGERELASLTENREPRRRLDAVWAEGAVDFCLGIGQWKFAKRTQQLAPSTTVAPDFGYRLAYAIPDDHIRTCALCDDEYLQHPLLAYQMEQNYIYADVEPIYLSFVSDDASYGGDYSLWPEDFIRVVKLYLAQEIVWPITQNVEKKTAIEKDLKRAISDAKSSDAMEGPTVFPPMGSFAKARIGRGRARSDRGSRGRLTG